MNYHLTYLQNYEIPFNLFTKLKNIQVIYEITKYQLIQLIYEIMKSHSTYL